MDTLEHQNSHKIFVRRFSTFANNSRKELDEYFAASHRGVGSYFQKGGLRSATGLSSMEENLLMPYLINIPAEDRDFRKEVTTFFQNMESKIPAHKTHPNGEITGGLELEIGLEVSNSEPISSQNLPINVEEFVRWRHIKGHPQVALEEASGKGNQLKKFFIYDPEAISAANIGINDIQDEAMGKYLVVKDRPRDVSMYLTLMGVNINLIKSGEEQMQLRKQVNKDPAKFLEVYEDKDREMKFLIEEAINHKILERVGQNVLTTDGDILGRSVKEAILHLTDARNSRTLSLIKARIQDYWKKKSISVETDEDLQPAEPDAAPIKITKASSKSEETTLDDIN